MAWRGVAWRTVVALVRLTRSLSLSFLPASLDLSFIVSLSVALLSLSLAPRHLSFALSASTALSITLSARSLTGVKIEALMARVIAVLLRRCY